MILLTLIHSIISLYMMRHKLSWAEKNTTIPKNNNASLENFTHTGALAVT